MLDFGNKIENEGATPQGRLSAGEFNTLVSAVNQNESDIAHLHSTTAVPGCFSLDYDNVNRKLKLNYTRSGTTTTLATIDTDDFVIGGSLTQAAYSDTDGQGTSGDYLMLEFSTGDLIYINLTPIVGAALTAIQARLTALEGKFEESTEEDIELMIENETWTPGVIYYTVED
ncbi:MAG: hypothetical protein K5920_09630 [Bacteroidales bacterium]|nr:hypothetical protein [Bacteroidales bacterium]